MSFGSRSILVAEGTDRPLKISSTEGSFFVFLVPCTVFRAAIALFLLRFFLSLACLALPAVLPCLCRLALHMTQAETALSEAEGASQVAAWESKSLREELQVLRERSAELSSALEAARAREAAATATAQDGVSLSVLFCFSFLVVFFRFVCVVRIFVVSSVVGLPVPSVRLYTGGGWGGEVSATNATRCAFVCFVMVVGVKWA